MKLLEYESKEILARHGIPVPASGGVFSAMAQLPSRLKKCGKGPWVLKAQVTAGGRGKAGGIQVVKNLKEAKEKGRAILGMELKTHQTAGQAIVVKEVLVEEALSVEKELYLSIAMDRKLGRPVLIASSQGGMEIEELARTHPEAILKEPIDPDKGLEDFQARRAAFALSIPGPLFSDFCLLAKNAARAFLESDANLLEINPLAIVEGPRLLALDAKIVLDDNSLFRHKDLRQEDLDSSPAEALAKKTGISYISLQGNIGCMVNGAGLAMGTMDVIKLAGGDPANFLDVGGGANVKQVQTAFEILLKDPKVKAVLVNIFGGIMKCDVIAQGILEALKKVKLKVPLVVRLEGTKVKEGREILKESGLSLIQAEDLWSAAQKAVQAAGRQ